MENLENLRLIVAAVEAHLGARWKSSTPVRTFDNYGNEVCEASVYAPWAVFTYGASWNPASFRIRTWPDGDSECQTFMASVQIPWAHYDGDLSAVVRRLLEYIDERLGPTSPIRLLYDAWQEEPIYEAAGKDLVGWGDAFRMARYEQDTHKPGEMRLYHYLAPRPSSTAAPVYHRIRPGMLAAHAAVHGGFYPIAFPDLESLDGLLASEMAKLRERICQNDIVLLAQLGYRPEWQSDGSCWYRRLAEKAEPVVLRYEEEVPEVPAEPSTQREPEGPLLDHLLDGIKRKILDAHSAGKIPPGWDGHELRCLVADFAAEFAEVSNIVRHPKGKRAKEYRNAKIANNI